MDALALACEADSPVGGASVEGAGPGRAVGVFAVGLPVAVVVDAVAARLGGRHRLAQARAPGGAAVEARLLASLTDALAGASIGRAGAGGPGKAGLARVGGAGAAVVHHPVAVVVQRVAARLQGAVAGDGAEDTRLRPATLADLVDAAAHTRPADRRERVVVDEAVAVIIDAVADLGAAHVHVDAALVRGKRAVPDAGLAGAHAVGEGRSGVAGATALTGTAEVDDAVAVVVAPVAVFLLGHAGVGARLGEAPVDALLHARAAPRPAVPRVAERGRGQPVGEEVALGVGVAWAPGVALAAVVEDAVAVVVDQISAHLGAVAGAAGTASRGATATPTATRSTQATSATRDVDGGTHASEAPVAANALVIRGARVGLASEARRRGGTRDQRPAEERQEEDTGVSEPGTNGHVANLEATGRSRHQVQWGGIPRDPMPEPLLSGALMRDPVEPLSRWR